MNKNLDGNLLSKKGCLGLKTSVYSLGFSTRKAGLLAGLRQKTATDILLIGVCIIGDVTV